MPTVSVDAGNDDVQPDGEPHTSVGVSGAEFPSGSTVRIEVDPGNHRGTADVDEDGKFEFVIDIRPQLRCHSRVNATVHGDDGLVVRGGDEVFCPGDAS
jgi:hypothetical protein